MITVDFSENIAASDLKVVQVIPFLLPLLTFALFINSD